MCTLVIAIGVWPGLPLMVAANRDEVLTRPAEGFARREFGPLAVLAPRDLLSGGTWMGLNAAGLFVAITNRVGSAPDPTRRSRGLLVHDALGYQDSRSAAVELGAIDPRDYNPFHLLMADRREAHLLWCDGSTVRREQLTTGLHVITERSFDAAPTRRPGRVSARLQSLVGAEYPGATWFQGLLASTDSKDPLEGVCVHMFEGPDGTLYGTRSSTILELRDDGVVLLDHLGPPRIVADGLVGTLGEPGGKPDDGWADISDAARALLEAD